jgi:hypothetical protein
MRARFAPNADIAALPREVRFVPRAALSRGNKRHAYAIASSACASSADLAGPRRNVSEAPKTGCVHCSKARHSNKAGWSTQ